MLDFDVVDGDVDVDTEDDVKVDVDVVGAVELDPARKVVKNKLCPHFGSSKTYRG